MQSTDRPLGASRHEADRPPTAAEIGVAVGVLRHFVAEGRFGADLEATGRVLGTLLDALRTAGGAGGAGVGAARAERSWRARGGPPRARPARAAAARGA